MIRIILVIFYLTLSLAYLVAAIIDRKNSTDLLRDILFGLFWFVIAGVIYFYGKTD